MSSYDCMDLCRLCLVKDRVSVPIFEGEGDVRQIFLKIAACLPVKVGREDKLPKKICDDCVYKVELLYEFWNTTANAEKQLLQWLGEDGEDKQGYVSNVMESELMKQETVENRLESSVMQSEDHQNSMNMNMMDQMGLTMPIIMTTDQQQITSVPMSSSGNNIQAVPGTSAQSPRGRKSGNNEEDEEESEDEDNSDDDCDNDGGINVKEETPETGRNVEPSFVNVTIPCDEAGPSGLQQQKLSEIPEMVMGPSSEGDPKSGEGESFGGLSGMLRQILSPSPETGDGSFAGYCSLIQPGIYNSYPSMLSPTIQHIVPTSSYHHPTHSTSLISLEQPTLDHLEIHVETHQCPNCGLDFRSVPKLNYHIRMCHQIIPKQDNNQIKYTCTYCGRGFPCLSHLRMHEVTHTNPQQIAQSNILNNQSINQMMTNDQNDQPFRCDKCQASFRYRTLLDRHKKMHTTGQDKPYVCPRCPMRFETRTLYNHHAKTHKQGTTTGGTIGQMQQSMPAPQIDKPLDPPVSYPCDSCTKQFLTIESLTSHKAVHRSRPLVCDVCGKGFTHRKYYVVHQRIHTGERPYLCAMCGKSFTQASTLTVHRRYHTGERPYTCTLCGKGFVTRTIMLNHMKKH